MCVYQVNLGSRPRLNYTPNSLATTLINPFLLCLPQISYPLPSLILVSFLPQLSSAISPSYSNPLPPDLIPCSSIQCVPLPNLNPGPVQGKCPIQAEFTWDQTPTQESPPAWPEIILLLSFINTLISISTIFTSHSTIGRHILVACFLLVRRGGYINQIAWLNQSFLLWTL